MKPTQEEKLERSIKNIWFTILFYLSMPVWVLSPFIIKWIYSNEFSYEIEIESFWINGVAYGIIFLISCLSLMQFYAMSKEMMKGNFYSKSCIHKLYRGSQLLQLTGFFLIIWNSISIIIKPDPEDVFFSFEFWTGYFLIILSVIFWYVTKSLREGASLQKENDLTI